MLHLHNGAMQLIKARHATTLISPKPYRELLTLCKNAVDKSRQLRCHVSCLLEMATTGQVAALAEYWSIDEKKARAHAMIETITY